MNQFLKEVNQNMFTINIMKALIVYLFVFLPQILLHFLQLFLPFGRIHLPAIPQHLDTENGKQCGTNIISISSRNNSRHPSEASCGNKETFTHEPASYRATPKQIVPDRTVMKMSAEIAPVKTIARGCRIAIIAAMKNVLSPSSLTMIIDKEAMKACVNPALVSFSIFYKNKCN